MSCKLCDKKVSDQCVKCFYSCCEDHLTSLVHPIVLKIVKIPVHKQCYECKEKFQTKILTQKNMIKLLIILTILIMIWHIFQ